jgi:lipoprotein-anchoring transpeptidase ErfK/SrfK
MTRTRAITLQRRLLLAVFAAAVTSLLLVVAPVHASSSAVVWKFPTRADQFRLSVSAGSNVTFSLKAAASVPGSIVRIVSVQGLPQGAEVESKAGQTANATFHWVPSLGGDYTVRFVASLGGRNVTTTRTYTIHVVPKEIPLIDDKIAHWAIVLKPAVARAAPSDTARSVTTLETMTTDGTQNDVLVLGSMTFSPTNVWYHVRLPILPNNSTGWIHSNAVGRLYVVHTHLYIDRLHFRATLKRDGKTIFTSIVGVGRPYWPTPHGEFYVRDKLTNFDNPFYGPLAFGTSARSAVLTDWPGGGYVGIHGTNEPQILPGRVSHGCIRMPNASILKLATLMTVGTPISIR